MLKSPLFRRVGIYPVLSTAAVTVVNQLQIEQRVFIDLYPDVHRDLRALTLARQPLQSAGPTATATEAKHDKATLQHPSEVSEVEKGGCGTTEVILSFSGVVQPCGPRWHAPSTQRSAGHQSPTLVSFAEIHKSETPLATVSRSRGREHLLTSPYWPNR